MTNGGWARGNIASHFLPENEKKGKDESRKKMFGCRYPEWDVSEATDRGVVMVNYLCMNFFFPMGDV